MVEPGSFESQEPAKPSAASGRGRRLVMAAVGIVLAAVLGVAVVGIAGPKPCASCHDRAAFRAGTQASAHARVECKSCHFSPGVIGDAVYAVRWPAHAYLPPGRTADRDIAAVPDSRCNACHETAIQDAVVSNGIRMNHATCAVGSSCTDCHSSTAHGSATRWVRAYDMDGCLGCHLESKKVACDLCHEGQAATARVKSVAFAVTHGPAWQSTHGMGDTTTCAVCHESSDCARCHGPGVPHEAAFVNTHTSFATRSDSQCASCHDDAFCTSCHGTQMPHPQGFTPRHVIDAKAKPALCDRCHEKSDCTNCHLKHVHPGGAIGTAASEAGGR